MKKQFAPGERVALARAFLQSTGQVSGPAPFARFTVLRLETISPRLDLVHLVEDSTGHLSKALSSNLVALDRLHLELP